MTVRKSKGRLRKLCCDFAGCKVTYGEPFDRDRLIQVTSSARMHGWHTNKDSLGIWRHECPAHDDGRGKREKRPAPMAGGPAQRFRADIDG